jgi:pimeloyl-ACP methyl ester carboxylesterase
MTAYCQSDTTTTTAATKMPLTSFSKTLSVGDRTIGYAVAEAASSEADRKTAILYFYPLSGSSSIIDFVGPSLLSLKSLKCSFVCVDRPSVRSTSMLLESESESDHSNDMSFDTHRILGHAQDVLKVVHHLGLERVYILGVCIGHPYAIQVCRELQKK